MAKKKVEQATSEAGKDAFEKTMAKATGVKMHLTNMQRRSIILPITLMGTRTYSKKAYLRPAGHVEVDKGLFDAHMKHHTSFSAKVDSKKIATKIVKVKRPDEELKVTEPLKAPPELTNNQFTRSAPELNIRAVSY